LSIQFSGPEAIRTTEARSKGFIGLLGKDEQLSRVVVQGVDAQSFLHSQTTADIANLEIGVGCEAARVSRTGHLEALFTVYRYDDDVFHIIVDEADGSDLAEGLDGYHFSEALTIELQPEHLWWVFQGSNVNRVLEDAVDSPLGNNKVMSVDGVVLYGLSLTGDTGVVAVGNTDGLRSAAETSGFLTLSGLELTSVLHNLRVECGRLRLAEDAPKGTRLLQETGADSRTVSYTKGCYLGQEVIARMRTYGSPVRLLRVLVVSTGAEFLPTPGADICVDGTEKRIGRLASQGYAPTRDAVVSFAYLKRDHREPGSEITFIGTGGVVTATVELCPLYNATDDEAVARSLYESGIVAFAQGDREKALRDLEAALVANPMLVDAYEVLGVILGQAERYHEAISVLRRLQEVNRDEPLIHTNLSIFYMKIGDKETAEREAEAARIAELAQKTGSVASATAQMREEELKSAERKLEMFSHVLTFDPVDPIALFGVGSAAFTLGQYELAVEHLSEATVVDPKNSSVWLKLGRALEELDRLSEAQVAYKSGAGIASKNGDLQPLRAMKHRSLIISGRLQDI
jgi:folate-binding protein YgfZ